MPSRPTKKPRRTRPGPTTPLIARASLTSLPIEILAEVLLYTCSPPTVLAVSRTCSFLYRTLVHNPAVSFIWRGVRRICRLPLPDLGDLWKKSEAEYAALVFGGGVCEVCQKTTRAMYVSFAVRIRLCDSWHCRRKFTRDFLVDVSQSFPREHRQALWVPFVESNRCFRPLTDSASTWPHYNTVFVRKTDLVQFQRDSAIYKDAEQASAERKNTPVDASSDLSAEDEDREHVMERCNLAIQRFPVIMELSARLIDWRATYDQECNMNKKFNQSWTKDLAEREGWNLADLVASQAYGSLQKRKTFLLERVTLEDVASIRSEIESELLTVRAHRERQKSEAAYKEKLTEVKKIYENMRCGTLKSAPESSEPLIVPTLAVFCSLPSVRMLRGTPDPNTVTQASMLSLSDIKSSTLASALIVSDIHKWLIPVQAHLMCLLGYTSGWQSASTRTLPPLKRVTARFFCRRCGEGSVARGYHREQCLDFKGVCSHVCVAAQRKGTQRSHQEALQEDEIEDDDCDDGRQEKGKGSRSKKKGGVKIPEWEVKVFEKDDKAVRFIKTILTLAGLSEEDPDTVTHLNRKGGTIRCRTCKGWIVMDFDTAIGHAHRHDVMDIELLPASAPDRVVITNADAGMPNGCEFARSQLAFERGTTGLLLGRSYRSRSLCKRVNYGCKHCFLFDATRNAVVGVEHRVKGKGQRAMNFDGLRSHVKTKHGIRDIRDEDFFCYTSIEGDDRETSGASLDS